MKHIVFKIFVCTVFSLSAIAATDPNQPLFTFATIADIQYCDHNDIGSTCYRSSIGKLTSCIDVLNQHKLEFVIQLGDLVDRDINSYAAVVPILAKIKAPVYNAMGNHDAASVAPSRGDELHKTIGLKDRYYDFVVQSWRFIVIDTTDISVFANAQGSEKYKKAVEMYDQLKKNGDPKAQPWNSAIGDEQFKWLRERLTLATQNRQKVIILGHHLVYPVVGGANLWNDTQFMDEVSKFDCVVAYICGHLHNGTYKLHNKIHYLTTYGMVETPDTTAYAIISIFKNRIEVNGFGREPDRTLFF